MPICAFIVHGIILLRLLSTCAKSLNYLLVTSFPNSISYMIRFPRLRSWHSPTGTIYPLTKLPKVLHTSRTLPYYEKQTSIAVPRFKNTKLSVKEKSIDKKRQKNIHKRQSKTFQPQKTYMYDKISICGSTYSPSQNKLPT